MNLQIFSSPMINKVLKITNTPINQLRDYKFGKFYELDIHLHRF